LVNFDDGKICLQQSAKRQWLPCVSHCVGTDRWVQAEKNKISAKIKMLLQS